MRCEAPPAQTPGNPKPKPNHKAMSERTFSPAQQAAIDSNHPLILAIAGPGSGKTTTLIGRIARLLYEGTSAASIACITFTNAAAKEMGERLAKLNEGVRLGYLGTLHGFALHELQDFGHALGYGEKISVVDEEQAKELMAEAAKDLGCKTKPEKLIELRREWSLGRSAFLPAELVVVKYLRALRAASAVDFDSLLADFAELVTRGEYVSGKWEHLIVDEFQDSGAMDLEIYDRLPVANRFFVGDPDQAIYGFRGGKVGSILALARNPKCEVHTMEGNYRCAQQICAAANALIRHNKNRIDKATTPAAGAAAPFGTLLLPRPFATDDHERSAVMENVQKICGEGTPPEEIAILARSNAIARDFVQSAEAMGLPIRKKVHPKTPEDWATARAAVELLNAPSSTLAARLWLRVRHREQAAALVQRAAKEQTELWRLIPDQLTLGVHMEDLPEAMARLGVSRESIELVMSKGHEIPDGDLSELSYVLARDLEHNTELGQGITITTIHGAKGREWGTVYLVGCEQEVMPGTSKKRDVEEERRICFVAITRAKARLLMTSAKARRVAWGSKRHEASTPSQFLGEVNALP